MLTKPPEKDLAYATRQTRNHFRSRKQTLNRLGHGAGATRSGCAFGVCLPGRSPERKRREPDESRDAGFAAALLRCYEAGRSRRNFQAAGVGIRPARLSGSQHRLRSARSARRRLHESRTRRFRAGFGNQRLLDDADGPRGGAFDD